MVVSSGPRCMEPSLVLRCPEVSQGWTESCDGSTSASYKMSHRVKQLEETSSYVSCVRVHFCTEYRITVEGVIAQ